MGKSIAFVVLAGALLLGGCVVRPGHYDCGGHHYQQSGGWGSGSWGHSGWNNGNWNNGGNDWNGGGHKRHRNNNW